MDISVWIAKLDQSREVHSQWNEIDGWLAKGERDTLIEIARVCARTEPSQWARRSIFDHIVAALALRSKAENVESLTQIFVALPDSSEEDRRRTTLRARVFASMLAQEQDAQTLIELSSWARDANARNPTMRHELFACCVQELVLRGRKIQLDDRAQSLLREHQLGVLPLQLLNEVERNFPSLLPRYMRGGGMGQSLGAPGPGASTDVGEARAVTSLHFDGAQLQSAVANWELESNGVISVGNIAKRRRQLGIGIQWSDFSGKFRDSASAWRRKFRHARPARFEFGRNHRSEKRASRFLQRCRERTV